MTQKLTAAADQLTNNKYALKQGVAVTKRNTTGPPCSVGRPAVHALHAEFPRSRQSASPPAGRVTDDDGRRQQTTASKTILAHYAGSDKIQRRIKSILSRNIKMY